jgi:hypothetical protein
MNIFNANAQSNTLALHSTSKQDQLQVQSRVNLGIHAPGCNPYTVGASASKAVTSVHLPASQLLAVLLVNSCDHEITSKGC